ncbi:MAG: D-amino-acid transaminase [Alphaproteobacteria bacterium]
MSRIAYVNGRYVAHRDATVHIEDRGYQFSDGVYEVVGVRDGRLFDEEPHLDRLERSLRELAIAPPMSRAALRAVMGEVLRVNRVGNGLVYIQVTRGVAPRDHAFPKFCRPSVVVTARRSKAAGAAAQRDGVRVITVPDIRWRRCDIKTIGLLPNVLGKQYALTEGAFEAWQVDDQGFVTEGTSTNAWIVTGEGAVVTRAADTTILGGITRAALLALIREEGYPLEERPFSVDEAKGAKEAFLTSTTSFVLPVVRIDDVTVGDGKPGAVTKALLAAYLRYLAAAAGEAGTQASRSKRQSKAKGASGPKSGTNKSGAAA